MRNDIQKLLESFGDNSRIGDVLAAMDEGEAFFGTKDIAKFMVLWRNCGSPERHAYTKPLQSIFEECEWEYEVCDVHKPNAPKYVDQNCWCHEEEVPKDPAVKALGEFLLSLNLCKKS